MDRTTICGKPIYRKPESLYSHALSLIWLLRLSPPNLSIISLFAKHLVAMEHQSDNLTIAVYCRLYSVPDEIPALSKLFAKVVRRTFPLYNVNEWTDTASNFAMISGTDLAITKLEVSLSHAVLPPATELHAGQSRGILSAETDNQDT